ncbi:MAG TPA: hypothetical protein VG164_10970 [Trebonia sp.]|nr:hypothetical protein [Trebonia sp.]
MCASQVDAADLAAGVVPVADRRPGLAGEPLVAPADHHHHHQQVDEFGAFAGEDVLVPRPLVVIEWINGDAAWAIVDQIAIKYTGQPYSRDQERVAAVIEPGRQTVGVR